MIPVVFVISVIVFYIIQLPPGDFVSSYAAKMATAGDVMTTQEMQQMRAQYGLDQHWLVQYFFWAKNIVLHFDFGYSYNFNKPVTAVIGQYLPLTLVVSIVTMAFTYLVAIPVGIYSAVKQYTAGDYIFTAIGFLGMATPHFLLAVILMYLSYVYFGDPLLGLFSEAYANSVWSFAKVLDR